MSKPKATEATSIRVLRRAKCPSLSGRSDVTYQLGTDTEGAIYLQLVSNSGGGKFNTNWVPLSAVEALLAECNEHVPPHARTLRSIYFGKSRNSPSFLFAVLLAESVVMQGAEKGSYMTGSFSGIKTPASVSEDPVAEDDSATALKLDATKRQRAVKDRA